MSASQTVHHHSMAPMFGHERSQMGNVQTCILRANKRHPKRHPQRVPTLLLPRNSKETPVCGSANPYYSGRIGLRALKTESHPVPSIYI